jgi:hypothetical protein
VISARGTGGAPVLDACAADGTNGEVAEQPGRVEAVATARADLADLASAYDRALRRGLTESSRQTIDHAFDETDRLGRRMLAASRRLRSLERAQGDTRRSVASCGESSR